MLTLRLKLFYVLCIRHSSVFLSNCVMQRVGQSVPLLELAFVKAIDQAGFFLAFVQVLQFLRPSDTDRTQGISVVWKIRKFYG